MEKRLIIVRHAHRIKKDGGRADNGLSGRGRRQSKSLLSYFKRRHGDASFKILSSPKRRCRETVLPLCSLYKSMLKESRLLLEGEDDSPATLCRRARSFSASCHQFEHNMIACSHGGWILSFIQIVAGTRIDLRKGGVIELVCQDRGWQIEWVLQDLSDF